MPAPPLPILPPTRGLITTQNEENIPADGARELENWIFRDGDFRVRPGLTTFSDDINERPTGYFSYIEFDGTYHLVMGTTVGWHVYDPGTQTWTDISGTAFTASAVQLQVFRFFQKAGSTFVLGCNDKDAPVKWDSDPTANYSAIGGSPPVGKAMMVLADRLLLLNLSSGATINPAAITVSNRVDFDTGWGTVLVAILANAGDIVAAEELGEFVGAIYCVDSIWLAIAQGSADPFRFDPKKQYVEGEGPASVKCVIKTHGGHIIFSANGDVHFFDGADWRSIWPDVARQIQKTANLGAMDRAWTTYDAVHKEILFVYPEIGGLEPSVGVMVKEDTGACFPVRWSGKNMSAGHFARAVEGITIGELVGTIGEIEGTIGELGSFTRRVVFGEIGGQSFEDFGDTDDGTGIGFFMETGLVSLGNGNRFKQAKRIEHRFRKSTLAQTVTIKVGKSNNGNVRVLDTGHNLDIGANGPYKTGHRRSSKYLSVRLEGTATQPVIWRGSFAELVNRGYR